MSERRAIRPASIREPYCIHSGRVKQPASACSTCCDSEFLRAFKDQWSAWLAENPDSWEARELNRLVREGYLEGPELGSETADGS